MIFVVGISISVFLAFLLLTKKNKSLSDKILLCWLISILAHLVLYVNSSANNFQHLMGVEIPLPFLHGPFLYLYTKSLTRSIKIRLFSLLHFLPFFLANLLILPFFVLDASEKVQVYQNDGLGYSKETSIIFAGILVSAVSYTFLSVKLLRDYQHKIKDRFSNLEKINLQWMMGLIFGLSLIWMIVLFANEKIIFSSVVVFVLYIGYFGVKQVGIFTSAYIDPIANIDVISTKTTDIEGQANFSKYEKTLLSDFDLEAKHRALRKLMDERKLFLTPELTLIDVADELGENANTLSQVINRIEKRNFFDYINKLRVEEFLERVAQPNNNKFTWLAIAHECGFNSKTSFNRNFKKITGKSPTDYFKQ